MIKAVEALGGTVVEATVGLFDTNTTRTMASLLKGQNVQNVEILKIDIEGTEVVAMEPFLREYRPAQVCVYSLFPLLEDLGTG